MYIAGRSEGDAAVDVLVVSDSEHLRKQLVEYLAEGDVDSVRGTESPEDARQHLGLEDTEEPAEDWGLLVVDLKGQPEDLLSFIRTCQSSPKTRHVPVLAVTRRADPRTVQELLSVGCSDFVETPLNKTVLNHHARIVRRLAEMEADQRGESQKIQQLEQKLEEAREKIQRLSNLDELTQLPTQDRFHESLRNEWSRLRRNESPLSVALVEVDDFLEYSEQHGKEKADEQLARIAHTLEERLKRPGDLVARYASSDFAVLLPETDLAGARTVGENMLQYVRALGIKHKQRPQGILTVSVGVSGTVPGGDSDPEQLPMVADEALQDAKQDGGDRVVGQPLT